MPDKLLGICAGGFVDWYDSTGKLKEGNRDALKIVQCADGLRWDGLEMDYIQFVELFNLCYYLWNAILQWIGDGL